MAIASLRKIKVLFPYSASTDSVDGDLEIESPTVSECVAIGHFTLRCSFNVDGYSVLRAFPQFSTKVAVARILSQT